MKTSLTSPMVSGTIVLLFTLTFPFALRAQPDGYTDDGQPYYYAYPDEGYAEPPSVPNGYSSDSYSAANPDDLYASGDYVDYYDAPWGWGWGWGVPFGFDGFNAHMHHHHMHGFVNHDRFNHNNRSAAVPHQNLGHARMAPRAGAHVGGGHGGGHR
ncbi:MAG: hypothetical protein ACXWBP_07105 [Limisphaerales bacterium]